MLKLSNVCSSYGKKEILHDLSANLEAGKITSIIGPNGCGKSTLLKTVMGILSLSKGEITIDGESSRLLDIKKMAKKVSYIPQNRSVPDMTVGQLVLHGRFAHVGYPRVYKESDKQIAFAACKEMGVDHLFDAMLPTLSGGMQQKVYIAMALAQDTDYILADEPITHLDILNQLELMQIFKKLAENKKGVITVVHDITLAMQYSDNVIVMNDGRVIDSNIPESIYQNGTINNVFGVELIRCEIDGGYGYFTKRRDNKIIYR